jgi:serine/threonine-protein kinase
MMRHGNFADACPRLEASKRLEVKSGTLIVLGSCYENTGRTASAWAQYKEAAALARAEGRVEHTNKATELAGNIEPRLSKLRIDAEILQDGAELVVTLDGKVVLAGQLGVAFAIDPGEHVVAASAPGRVAWSRVVAIGPESDAQVVAIPKLEHVPEPPVRPAAAPVEAIPPPPRQPETPPADAGIPAWAWVSGGLGVALGAVATGFAIDQHRAASTIDEACTSARDRCPAAFDIDGVYAREQRGFGLFVGLGVAGVVGIGVGVVGIALAVGDDGASLALAPGFGGGSLEARF